MGYVEDREVLTEVSDVRADDLVKVAAFIAWHEPNCLWGGVNRKEAFDAFCRLIGIKDPDRCFRIVREEN